MIMEHATSNQLCSVCSKLNFTFRFPPLEPQFEEWLAEWEERHPRFSWKTTQSSAADDWDSEDEDDEDSDLDLSSSVPGSEPSDDGEEDEDDGDGGDDDERHTDSASATLSEALVDNSLDAGSDNTDDEREDSLLRLNEDEAVEAEPVKPGLFQGGGYTMMNQDDPVWLAFHEEERRLRDQIRMSKALRFLGMDPSEYKVERRAPRGGRYPRLSVTRCKDLDAAAGSAPESLGGYEPDDMETINILLEDAPDYAFESDEGFLEGIRERYESKGDAEGVLRERWLLETHNARRRYEDAHKTVNLGTILDLTRRLPCRFCTLVLEMFKPTLKEVDYYNRDEFEIDWVPKEEESQVVSLQFEHEYAEEREFTMHLYAPTELGCLRKHDQTLKVSAYDGTPWLPPKLEIAAYQRLDSDRFQADLIECERDHIRCRDVQHATTADQEYETLFVDVERKCLVSGTLGQRYFALSYVWGNAEMLHTKMENLGALTQTGSLDSIIHSGPGVPRTIRDAMTLTQRMGERFLWVDALCIVQDDMENKARNISNMDLIYRQAVLTIIAHSGTGVDAPLPGVADGTRFPIVRAWRIGDVEVISQTKCFRKGTMSSVYETRGWTYQEEALSPRRLYLYRTHANFECCTSISQDVMQLNEQLTLGWFQNTMVSLLHKNSKAANTEDGNNEGVVFNTEGFRLYYEIVRSYASRELTFPSDKLNAFAGIVKVLERAFRTPFVDGLPERFLDAALLWSSQPKGNWNYGWSSEGHLQIYARNSDFPSWSWAGHTKRLSYDGFSVLFTQSDGDLEGIRSEVAGFAVLQPDGCFRSVVRSSENCPLIGLAKGDRDITSDLRPTVAEIFNGRNTRKANILCFSARTVPWECLAIDSYADRLSAGRIFTADERRCGLLFPDDSEVWRSPSRGQRKWIILSRGCIDGPEDLTQGPEGISYTEHFKLELFSIKCKWTFYHLMLVEERRIGEGQEDVVVERIALGQIHIDAWPEEDEKVEMVFLG